MTRCNKCGTTFDVSIALTAAGEVRVLRCRVCPANAVFAVCDRCANLEQVQSGPCPQCNAHNLWEIQRMIPV